MIQESQSFDLVVIGSGPGGQRAAVQAAKVGKTVAIIEKDGLGGGCAHWGTLPSKSMRESVYRWSLGSRRGTPDVGKLFERKNRVIENEVTIVENQLSRNHVKIFHGVASFTGAHTLKVKLKTGSEVNLRAAKVVIATGARPIAPAFAKIDGEKVYDSDTILHMKKLPKSMILLGGGIIGCEFASMFLNLGVKLTMVDKRPEILASVDREIVFHLVDLLSSKGIKIELNADTTKLEVGESGVRLHIADGRMIEADACLIALGRTGNTEELNLAAVDLQADQRGLLKVDRNYQTEVPWIYAVGDVIGFPALAATSLEQGRIAAAHAFNLNEDLGRMELYPYGIYTIPEVSCLGMTEEEVQDQHIPYVVGRAKYREIARGQIVGDEWGFMKMLVHKETLKILGVHIIGDNAADLIHIGQAVMQLDGDLKYFIRNVFNYPTLAEAYKSAAFNAYNQILGRTSHTW